MLKAELSIPCNTMNKNLCIIKINFAFTENRALEERNLVDVNKEEMKRKKRKIFKKRERKGLKGRSELIMQ